MSNHVFHGWALHCCALDKEDRDDLKGTGISPPWRIHLNTPWFHFAFALSPGNRFAYVDRRARWTDTGIRKREDCLQCKR